MRPLVVLGSGMVTGVGLSSAATCAATRAAISGFTETRFTDGAREWVIGSQVPLPLPLRGRGKLARLAASAIGECLGAATPIKPEAIPVLLCVAEKDRPGRLDGLDDGVFEDVQGLLGIRFHPRSRTIPGGRIGGAVAADLARKLIYDERLPACLVAGVDSLLVGPTLAAYESKRRLLTSDNSNGFIPGEAGAAALLGPPGPRGAPELRVMAIGFGREPAPVDSEEPLRGDGLVAAFRALYADGGVTLDDAEYRYTDCNGEQYGFKQDRLAISRTVRKLKARFDHLHPADCVGEIGAAVVPCVLGLALTAARKGYAPGNGVLCHFSNDDGERAAMLLRYVEKDGPS
jgi:3-oxoacyl-[acyl-carrier-protein] synthase-1